MKKLPFYFLVVLLISINYSAFAQDDVYFDPSDEAVKVNLTNYDVAEVNDLDAEYDDYVGYEAAEVDFENDYDYTYESRIRRFNRAYQGFGYFDPIYVDGYYYGNGYIDGASIYASSYRWRPQRANSVIYVLDPFNNYYSPYYTNVYNSNPYYYNNNYNRNTYYNSSYYNNNPASYGNIGFNSASVGGYDPCSPFGGGGYGSTNYGYSGGSLSSSTNTATSTVRPTQGTNAPGQTTTTSTPLTRGDNIVVSKPKPTAGRGSALTKPETTTNSSIVRPKSSYYSNTPSSETVAPKVTRSKTKTSVYTKPSRSSSKPSRSYSAPNRSSESYSAPKRSSRSYSAPSRSRSSYSAPSSRSGSSGTRSSGSSSSRRGGK